MKKLSSLILQVLVILCSCSDNGTSYFTTGDSGSSKAYTWSEIQELPSTQYQSIMATGFDGLGNILGLLSPDRRQFSIAKFSNNIWDEPDKLPPQDYPGYLMQFRFRIDQNGNSMFVWSAMEVYRSTQHIYAAQFNVETGWGKIEEVESFSDISSTEPEAKFDNHNNLLVVWRNEEQESFSLWSSYYSSNDNFWLKEETIGNSAFASEKYLQFTSDDQAVLFWREHPNMLLSRARNGQNWEKPIQLNLPKPLVRLLR